MWFLDEIVRWDQNSVLALNKRLMPSGMILKFHYISFPKTANVYLPEKCESLSLSNLFCELTDSRGHYRRCVAQTTRANWFLHLQKVGVNKSIRCQVFAKAQMKLTAKWIWPKTCCLMMMKKSVARQRTKDGTRSETFLCFYILKCGVNRKYRQTKNNLCINYHRGETFARQHNKNATLWNIERMFPSFFFSPTYFIFLGGGRSVRMPNEAGRSRHSTMCDARRSPPSVLWLSKYLSQKFVQGHSRKSKSASRDRVKRETNWLNHLRDTRDASHGRST